MSCAPISKRWSTRARKAKARVLLVGMRLPPNYGPAYTEKFQQTYGDVARANRKTALVPFLLEGFAETARYFQPDRRHPPDGRGAAADAETSWKGLQAAARSIRPAERTSLSA